MALCPRLSTSRDTRGATRNVQAASVDDTVVASNAEAPASVSIAIGPMVAVKLNMRIKNVPASKRNAGFVAKMALYAPKSILLMTRYYRIYSLAWQGGRT